MDPDEKVRENRLRRMVERQGHGLMKSRRRDSQAYDLGTYSLIDPFTNAVVLADSPGACLPLAEARILSCIRSFAKGAIDR
jgi:hypothetical protein